MKAAVNSKTFFMGVYGSYGGNQYLSVNNGGEVNASEKISLVIMIKTRYNTCCFEGGKISAPTISLSTNSELALGAQEGSAAKAAGIIDAEKLSLCGQRHPRRKSP